MSDEGRASENRAPEEATKAPNAGKPAEMSDEVLDKVSGGGVGQVISNITNMKHESLKAVAQNLRG